MSDDIPENRVVKLKSSDNVVFEMRRNTIKRAGTIETLIEHLNLDDSDASTDPIPLPDVSSKTLDLVVKFCEQHANDPIFTGVDDDVKKISTEWDNDFFDIDQTALYHLMLAANYLDIKCLLRGTCRTVAAMVSGKTVDEMRTILNIKNDFNAEEEEQIKKENSWCEM